MKLTKQRLIEIIKEEYKSILNEKTIRMGDLDMVFRGNEVQLISNKGRTSLSKMDAKTIKYAVQKHFSIHV